MKIGIHSKIQVLSSWRRGRQVPRISQVCKFLSKILIWQLIFEFFLFCVDPVTVQTMRFTIFFCKFHTAFETQVTSLRQPQKTAPAMSAHCIPPDQMHRKSLHLNTTTAVIVLGRTTRVSHQRLICVVLSPKVCAIGSIVSFEIISFVVTFVSFSVLCYVGSSET